MTGKLDEISLAIGGLKADSANLQNTLTQHCDDDDRRHRENLDTLKEINATIGKLNETVAPLAAAVGAMKPLVDSFQVTKWKMAGGLSVIIVLLGALGWILKTAISGAISWVLHH